MSVLPSSLADLYTTGHKTYQVSELSPKESLVLHERIWFIQAGILEINLLDSDGNLCFVGLGTRAMVVCGSSHLCYEVQALSASCLLSFTVAEVCQSSHLQGLICQGQRYRQYYSDLFLKVMHYPTALERLYEVLVVLSHIIGIRTPTGIRLSVRLTHAQLSHYSGITRVTVTRLLHQLLQQGRLSWGRDRHLILLGGSFGQGEKQTF